MRACKNREPRASLLEWGEAGRHSKTAAEQSRPEQRSGEEIRTKQSKAEEVEHGRGQKKWRNAEQKRREKMREGG